jgi:hypothetical protein
LKQVTLHVYAEVCYEFTACPRVVTRFLLLTTG